MIPATGKHCLKFYYNAFGNGMGKLEVKIKGKAEKLFEAEGNKGIKWHKVQENIDENQPFQVSKFLIYCFATSDAFFSNARDTVRIIFKEGLN